MADYSDWVYADDTASSRPKSVPTNSSRKNDYSGWIEVPDSTPTSMQQPQTTEPLKTSLVRAIPRIGEDIYRGAMNALKSAPEYFSAAKTEVPGVLSDVRQHPLHAAQQATAGLAELGQNIFNSPHDLVNYATKRLNLIPESVNEKVQMARMPDAEQDINNVFGEPNYPGDKLLRGASRNALNLYGAGALGSAVNPLKLSAKSIANDVLNTEKKQVALHSKEYNKIWKEAENSGFNKVPVDTKLLENHLDTISKYKTPKEYQSLQNLIEDPTLQNAQKAQSDMGVIHRKLEEKSRTGSLLSEERAMYDAAKGAEKHIEENMFKNSSGALNESLKNKYSRLTNSYRENVVPYKYNSDIQAYKNREMLPKELVNALSRGEFAAKKGDAHPAIKLRNAFMPIAATTGILSGANWLYNQMFGNHQGTK